MEILTDAHKIEEKLIECINKYENISMSVAWASSRSNAFKELVKNKNKIQTSTVGLHFYQTDPEFIEVFLNDRKLEFFILKFIYFGIMKLIGSVYQVVQILQSLHYQ